MFIKMKDTYQGSVGLFIKDQRYDVPMDIIKLLPKGSFEECKAPWDEHVDEEAVQIAEADAEAKKARLFADKLQTETEQARGKIKQLGSVIKSNQAEIKKAKAEAEKLEKIAVDLREKAAAKKAEAKAEAEEKAKAEAETRTEAKDDGETKDAKEETEGQVDGSVDKAIDGAIEAEGDKPVSEGQAVSP